MSEPVFTIVGVPIEAVEDVRAALRRRGLELGHVIGSVLKVSPADRAYDGGDASADRRAA